MRCKCGRIKSKDGDCLRCDDHVQRLHDALIEFGSVDDVKNAVSGLSRLQRMRLKQIISEVEDHDK